MSIGIPITIMVFALAVFVLVGALTAVLAALAGSRTGRLLLAIACLPIVLVFLGILFSVSWIWTREHAELSGVRLEHSKANAMRRSQEPHDGADRHGESTLAWPAESVSDESVEPGPTEDSSANEGVDGETSLAEIDSETDFVDIVSTGTPAGVTEPGTTHTTDHLAASVDDRSAPTAGKEASPRPDWLAAAPSHVGKRHWVAASTGPFSTLLECEQALPDEVKAAVARYNDWYLQQHGRSHRNLLRAPRYDVDLSESSLQFHEITQSKILGDMHNLHLRLDFDEAYRRRLEEASIDTAQASRLTRVAVAFGGVLAVLATLNSYLRLDTATDGSCRRRLQCAAVGAILALAACGVLLVRWIPWM